MNRYRFNFNYSDRPGDRPGDRVGNRPDDAAGEGRWHGFRRGLNLGLSPTQGLWKDGADSDEPVLQGRRGSVGSWDPGDDGPLRYRPSRAMRVVGLIFPLLVVLAAVGYFVIRYNLRKEMREALPQLDGSIAVPKAGIPLFGLAAPVTVSRDARGVPYIRAGSVEDMVYAQGYVTAQDRLWQMELLRRHAAGQLAEVLGGRMLDHDRLQRTLQLRSAADRALASMPADDKRWLEMYARGVNASMTAQRAHLPLEFRVLQYAPAPWTARDSLLVELALYQDLTTAFPEKLGREALAAHLPAELMADLYPVGSWRDHPPGQPAPDLTAPQPEFEDIPLDESQTRLRRPGGLSEDRSRTVRGVPAEDLMALERTLALFHEPCGDCVAGSNGWAVSGARTASGKPILSNDMHLGLTVPGIWYEADLEAQNQPPLAEFHAAGVTLPGTPFVIAGHNAHIAWGFTNLGADVQDLYIENTRGTPGGAEYQTIDGQWHAMRYRREVIHVRGAKDVTLDVPLVQHGDAQHGGAELPVISSIFPGETRNLSLRWTVYDPANVGFPAYTVNSASDWTSILKAFADFGGPAQNLMYADDQGHIGYHAIGRIPLRGDVQNPAPLSGVPTDAVGPGAAAHEWVGYIPFDQLPQAFDPPDGVLATANARVTLDGYRYPITLNWSSAYRTGRIYKQLETTPGQPLEPRRNLTPADMLALQTDDYSELDRIIAQRLAYSIDHTTGPLKDSKTLRQAADLLRGWNGNVEANAAAPAIVNAAREAFWPMLLIPRLAPQLAAPLSKGDDITRNVPSVIARDSNLWRQYVWGERASVEEQMVTDFPARWLPQGYAKWEDFLAAVVDRGLRDAHAPRDLKTWKQGKVYPLEIKHPIFSQSALLENLIGAPTGVSSDERNGDRMTVLEVGPAFGASERFTADMSDPDRTTLDIVLGQSGNVSSPWYMDQFADWLHGRTYPLPFSPEAAQAAATHTVTLTPQ